MQADRDSVAAVLVYTDLAAETVNLLQIALEQAGFAPVSILPALPKVLPRLCFLVLDETVSGVEAETLLQTLPGNDKGICVLVSAPYVQKITRLKFDPSGTSQADVVIIKGEPEHPSHLDMSITATSEPMIIAALFKRMATSLQNPNG